MENGEQEEEGEPIWLEDNDSEEEEEVEKEEEVSLVNYSATASQSTLSSQNNFPHALKTLASNVHSASNHLQSLNISAGD